MPEKFPGIIKAGKTRYADSTMAQIRQYLATIPDGPVWMQIWRRGRTESDPMRRYAFAVMYQMIEEETGHSKDALHDFMKRKFLAETDKYGIETVPSVFGRKSKMDIKEKWQFIMNVRNFAADFLNMWIPAPDKEWAKQKHRRAA